MTRTQETEAPPLEIVVAMAENGVIGRDGDLPWHLPDDLRHFQRLTTGHVLLMGRKTWESLGGRPLPRRHHLVLSRDPSFAPAVEDLDAVEVFADLPSALERGAELIPWRGDGNDEDGDDDRRLFAIGGEAVFRAALPLVRDLHLTRVHAEPEGDVCFPALDLRHFRKVEEERHPADERHEHAFTIEHWRREEDATDLEDDDHAPLTCGAVGWSPFRSLLHEHGLDLRVVPDGRPIPATYWGEPEAGLRGDVVFARADTPVHSLLHEACHAILAGADRRRDLDVDAESGQAEEDAVCLLQVLLADRLPGVGRERLMRDMDAWGYRFLAGSTEDFVREGSDAARELLAERDLLPDPPEM